ncbi:hypothetical protein ACJIZ3_011428 [Penstemon smallii]|uniref:BHLH domain-containing protein n=1 Tax=Penstemon smallii TaxID=265156 RepID=A0ABD3UJ35_9LAMI
MNSLNVYSSDHFGMIDFMDEANIDQFIDLIRGENEAYINPIANFNSNQGFDYDNDQLFSSVPQVELLDFDTNWCLPTEFSKEAEEEIEEESLATTCINNGVSKKKVDGKKVDRSKTLVSEQKRRGRMKEKLYALRALVPNITKLDKASIVGDAVLYVQDLQMQAKKLKAEIANLESSLLDGDKYNGKTKQNSVVTSFNPILKKIFKMDVFQVEERGFYVKVVTNKGKGVAVVLYKALESCTSFNVRNSNLTTYVENYVFTFTLLIKESEKDISLPNMKLWITSIFLNFGFDFETSLSS